MAHHDDAPKGGNAPDLLAEAFLNRARKCHSAIDQDRADLCLGAELNRLVHLLLPSSQLHLRSLISSPTGSLRFGRLASKMVIECRYISTMLKP